jgi:NAD(P)H-hydrate epimerase
MELRTVPQRSGSAAPLFTTAAGATVPLVSRADLERVFEAAAESGFTDEQVVEHAGLHLADLAYALGAWRGRAPSVVVLAGHGRSGAAGAAAARQLSNRGAVAAVFLAHPLGGSGPALRRQLSILSEAGIPFLDEASPGISSADVIIDALAGSPPLDTVRHLAHEASRCEDALVIAVERPLAAASARTWMTDLRAAATLALGLPARDLASEMAGDIWLADVGLPRLLFSMHGLPVPPRELAHAGMLRLHRARDHRPLHTEFPPRTNGQT